MALMFGDSILGTFIPLMPGHNLLSHGGGSSFDKLAEDIRPLFRDEHDEAEDCDEAP